MEIRVVVCGDEGVGKSSLIAVLVKDTFVPSIQALLPPITIPGFDSASTNTSTTTVLVDTSSLPSDRDGLNHEIRRASVIWLAYADHFTFERVSLFWLPYFRSLGVNVPVILCANKSDLQKTDAPEVIMEEFKEVEACIECSAQDNYNVNEAFYLCQRAVTHPLAPLYDSKEHKLKPLAQSALTRVFFLCDKDQDGYLSETELSDLQYKAFKKHLKRSELQEIRTALALYDKQHTINGTVTNDNNNHITTSSNNNNNNDNNSRWMSERAFILLNQLFAERGRHETTWGILRAFHYTDSLSLDDKFLYPKLDVPPFSSVELSPVGYRFFVDLFILFDKDNDGGLSDMELAELFKPTPGIPELWRETNFPNATVRNEAGYITLQGWLAQWSMTTFLDYKVTLAYLAWLGFESGQSKGGSTLDALLVTKPRRRSTKRPKAGKVDRNVFQCFILGAPGSGKSVLLDRFLNRPFYQVYIPTITSRIAVNSVETRGGKQCYMIIEELGSLESAILANQAKLDQCDLICYTYDSSDPESFSYLIDLRNKYPQLDQLPVIYAALKADLDKQQQRCELQPDIYTREIGVAAPLHVSSQWPGTSFSSSLNQLFIEMAEAAQMPSTATPRLEPQPDPEYSIRPMILAVSAFSLMTATAAWIWQNARKTS